MLYSVSNKVRDGDVLFLCGILDSSVKFVCDADSDLWHSLPSVFSDGKRHALQSGFSMSIMWIIGHCFWVESETLLLGLSPQQHYLISQVS